MASSFAEPCRCSDSSRTSLLNALKVSWSKSHGRRRTSSTLAVISGHSLSPLAAALAACFGEKLCQESFRRIAATSARRLSIQLSNQPPPSRHFAFSAALAAALAGQKVSCS